MSRHRPRLLILYGPPASGKSTVTAALENLDPRFRLFRRLKAGEGRRSEYRMVAPEVLERLRTGGEIIWENRRYGAVYATDRGHIAELLADGVIPVLHVGQAEAVDAIAAAFPDARLIRVSLTVPRAVAAARINERATGDASDRLAAYDATPPLPGADLIIDTTATSVAETARRIARVCLNTTEASR
jgi:guanylate kinase